MRAFINEKDAATIMPTTICVLQSNSPLSRYGGPDSYQVTEKFNMDWGMYLVTNKSIIYAAIDGRGSGLMGNDMLFAGYRQLGTVEIFDQINVTRWEFTVISITDFRVFHNYLSKDVATEN